MTGAESKISIRSPDDFHVHLRDGEMLSTVAPLTASQFQRAIIMPNLKPPICTVDDARAYRDRILSALPSNHNFTPLMTLYLTDNTSAQDIEKAYDSGFVNAVKLYPMGATTNSANGVTNMNNVYPALEAMQKVGMVLCVHGEATSASIDVFDKEAHFVEHTVPDLLNRFPTLKIVLEHVTTSEAVKIVQTTPGNRLAATITAHHLLYSRQALFAQAKIHPHMYCLPILKRETHRQALLSAIASAEADKFFCGTDSAPHRQGAKTCAEGCAGIFTANNALELYAEAFEEAGAMHCLNGFLSENGARFYGLQLNEGCVVLEKKVTKVPKIIEVEGGEGIVPLRAGETVKWAVGRE